MGARFQVLFHSPLGVLFTFPSRYWFAIGHRRVLQAWMVVHPGSDRVSRARPYSGIRVARPAVLRVRGCHPCAGPPMPFPSPGGPAPGPGSPRMRAHNPDGGTPAACTRAGLALVPFRSPLLAESRLISSSSGYLDVSVPRVASSGLLCSARGSRALPRLGSPIRRSAGRRMFAPHRGLSQLAASFVGFLCQGIRRAPLVSCGTAPRDIHVSLN